MIICVCNNINEKKIRHEVRCGRKSVKEIQKCSALGKDCGLCINYANEVVNNELNSINTNSLNLPHKKSA